MQGPGGPFTASVRVAYQTRQPVSWRDEKGEEAGRTFEEAFAFQNLEWCQDAANAALGLRVKKAARNGNLAGIVDNIFAKVRNLDKTKFALALIGADASWFPPSYIVEGLEWLAEQLGVADRPQAPAVVAGDGE